MRRLKLWSFLGCSLVIGLGFLPSAAGADVGAACRSYSENWSFTQERNDFATAAANGRTNPEVEDSGEEEFTFIVSGRMSDRMRESLAAGCRVEVVTYLRVTVQEHGTASARAIGTYTFAAPGNPADAPDTVVLDGCDEGTCQLNYDIDNQPLTEWIGEGGEIVLTTSSSAYASAEEGSSANQSSATWDMRYVYFRIQPAA